MLSHCRVFVWITPLLGVGACTGNAPGRGAETTRTVQSGPTLTKVSVLTGAAENTDYRIDYARLADAADENDRDGNSVAFRVEGVEAGGLVESGQPVAAGESLLATGGVWVWTPPRDASGAILAFKVRAVAAGVASADTVAVVIAVVPAGDNSVNQAPRLSAMAAFGGARLDQPFTVTYAALLQASGATDPEGDAIRFRLVAVASGTLQSGATPVAAGTLLAAGESWMWTPPNGTWGTLDAFSITAFDGLHDSDLSASVSIKVRGPNHPPVLTGVSLINGAKKGLPFTLSYSVLAAATDVSDADGDPITFRLESVQFGVLNQAGQAALVGSSLGVNDAPWVWTADSLGEFAAFSISATDGEATTGPVQVTIGVTLPVLTAEWLGGFGVSSGWVTSGWPSGGSNDGMLRYPADITAFGSYLYVPDDNNSRLVKLVAATGEMVGWVGAVDLPPLGGEVGCAGAARGSITPGWCYGGTAMAAPSPLGALNTARHVSLGMSGMTLYITSANGVQKYDMVSGTYLGGFVPEDGGTYFFVDGIAVDLSYIYLSDPMNGRVVRYGKDTGAFSGWLGKVATKPSSCSAGGVLPAVDAFTGSWCYGGQGKAGTGLGELTFPHDMEVSGGTLYVTSSNGVRSYDASTGAAETFATSLGDSGVTIDGGKLYASDWAQVVRYDLATGALEAWLGEVGGTPPLSCVLPPVPQPWHVTGSWCTGGTAYWAGQVSSPGAFAVASGLSVSNGVLYVSDATNNRVQAFNLTTGAPLAWLGAIGEPLTGWTNQDEPGPATGVRDGVLSAADGVAHDAAADAVYVVTEYRLNKFSASSGAFVGWTGRTATAPSTCEQAVPSNLPRPTGGWCAGGTPEYGSDDGSLSGLLGVATSNGYIYVADGGSNRIVRFAASGTFAGWIGTIGSTTGMTPGACAAAGVGSFTPDWCFGGSASLASTAALVWVYKLAVSGNTLIASGVDGERLYKIDITPGAVRYIGWTGLVGPSAGDVPTSCAGGVVASVANPTRAWCQGGKAAPGYGDGMFSDIGNVTQDASGNVYVVSTGRVSKLDADGAFVGWVGDINGTISGGPCNGASSTTPGWCTGGVSLPSYSAYAGLAYDSDEDLLYVGGNCQVKKYNGATGAFLGWAGEVSTSPTGGEPGCTATPGGELTPGWCTGGWSRCSSKHGALAPRAIAVGADYLYLLDSDLGRVTRLSKHPH